MGWNQSFRQTRTVFWIIGLSTLCLAKPDSLVLFKRITALEGLSQNTVNVILEDHQGFMWFGTQDGLNRFDGYRFKTFRHLTDDSQSISQNYILSLFEDQTGVLWVGTRGGGLNRYNRETETFTRWKLNSKLVKNRTANGITCITEDGEGNLWVGTFEGLIVLDENREYVTSFTQDATVHEAQLSDTDITALFTDRKGHIWVGTQNGLNRWRSKQQHFEVFKHDPRDPTSLKGNRINALFQDITGLLWVGTNKGFNRLDPVSSEMVPFQSGKEPLNSTSSNRICDLVQDTSGSFWLATDDAGLNLLKPQSRYWTHMLPIQNDSLSLSGQNLKCVYLDSRNLLWVGTTFGGINVTDLDSKPFYYLGKTASSQIALTHTNVLSVLMDQEGILWVGTVKGLNAINRKGNQTTSYFNEPGNLDSISGDQVVSIFEDSRGHLWFGTARNGVNRFDRSTETFQHFKHNPDDPKSLAYNGVYSILEDHAGTIWLGTLGGGLEEFDPSTQSFIHNTNEPGNPASISVNSIYVIVEDHNQNLLLGTYGGGLNILSPDRTSIRHLRKGPGSSDLKSDFVMSILEDRAQRLWLGTTSGLQQVDLELGVLQHFTENNGLANDVIYSVLEDSSGFLWCSTNRGLSRIDPEQGIVTNFDHSDGLQDNEFNFGPNSIDKDGIMYFGGIGGLTYFDPTQIVDNERPPGVVLTEFLLLNRPLKPNPNTPLNASISIASQVTLSYSDYIFGFEFAALNFRYPAKSLFKYRLQGFDKNWITTDAKNRRATYTNIPPGTYSFQVQASNQDGYWNMEGRSIEVTIIPPPWKTWWAYLLYTVAFMAFVFWFIQTQRRKFRFKQAELNREKAFSRKLETEVKERTKEVVEQKEKLEEVNRKLTQLATIDSLTGIANVRRFREFLFFEWKRALRDQQPISLIMMDVDFFKNFNDTYGHLEGDRCLKQVGEILKKINQRATDLAARYGGEEFAFVLTNTDKKGAINIAERIRAQIQQKRIPHQGSPIHPFVTISLGVACMTPSLEESHAQSPDDLIQLADLALYRSKEHGRNRVSFHGDTI